MENLIIVTDSKGQVLTFKTKYQAEKFVKSAKANYKKYLNEDVSYKIERVNLTKY